MKYKNNKKAEAGIGTLILFIAMILVAAIAASVLIQTSSSLQSKALATGSKAKTQISTQIAFNSIYAEDGADGQINDIFVEVKLVPGSDPVKLAETLVDFVLSNNSKSMSNAGTSIESPCTPPAGNFYNATYMIQGPQYKQGYLQLGDVLEICFISPQDVGESQEFRVQIVPKVGSMSNVLATTPDVIVSQKVELFP